MKRMIDSYYFHFEPTGVAEVDAILQAVANAGRAFHSTEEWSGGPFHREGEKTHTELIQEAADDAAKNVCFIDLPKPTDAGKELAELAARVSSEDEMLAIIANMVLAIKMKRDGRA